MNAAIVEKPGIVEISKNVFTLFYKEGCFDVCSLHFTGRQKLIILVFSKFFPPPCGDRLSTASGLNTVHGSSLAFESTQGFCFNLAILTHANGCEDFTVRPALLIKLLLLLAINCVDNLCESAGRVFRSWESGE